MERDSGKRESGALTRGREKRDKGNRERERERERENLRGYRGKRTEEKERVGKERKTKSMVKEKERITGAEFFYTEPISLKKAHSTKLKAFDNKTLHLYNHSLRKTARENERARETQRERERDRERERVHLPN